MRPLSSPSPEDGRHAGLMALPRQTGEGVALTANILQQEAAVPHETECLLFLHKALIRQPSLCAGSGKRVSPPHCRQVWASRSAGNFCAWCPQGRNPTPLLLRYGKGRALPREDFSFSAKCRRQYPHFYDEAPDLPTSSWICCYAKTKSHKAFSNLAGPGWIHPWCPERGSNPHSRWPRDFKSLVSACSTIRAK